MTRRRLGLLGAVVCISFASLGSAHAASIPLSDLINGQTIESGDKVFSDFTYTPTGDMPPSAASIVVQDIQDAAGDYGVRFVGGFLDQPGGGSSDALITFNVSVAPGSSMEINGAKLAANPAVFAGTGLASVTETFVPEVVDDKLVVYDFGGGDDLLLATTTFNQTFQTLPVQKDIIMHATSESGAVTMSFIDQTFSQVPEPSSLILLLLGLFGIRRLSLNDKN